MKRYLVGMVFAALAGYASADQLTDANKLLAAKSYPQALKLYSELAHAGSAEAQFHLGEMHWYGEGVEASEATAQAWFGKASGAGHQGAAAALAVMKERVARRADIDFYLSRYDGADVALDRFKCGDPAIPAVSTTNADIKAVGDRVTAWMKCYNGFVENMAAVQPPGKSVPPDVAKLMNEPEWNKAVAHIDLVYGTVISAAKAKADGVLAANAAWTARTGEFALQENARQKEQRAKYDEMERQRFSKMYESDYVRPKPQVAVTPGK